jgi:osmotically-inducible protein OsmY
MRRLAAVLLLGALSVPLVAATPTRDDTQTIEDIRRSLLRIPQYGVFDFLAFRYDRGVVTLSGYAYAPGLENAAVRAAKNVRGVDEVKNDIQPLVASSFDDRIRWATFYRIYNDSFLSRYAAGGGLSRIDRHFHSRRFPGMQPFGAYPIHIVVDRGRTTLFGNVDNDTDRTVAGIRAREVFGTFSVENEIAVKGQETTSARK